MSNVQEVIQILEVKGPSTVSWIGKYTELSDMAIRQALAAGMERGYVQVSKVKGRPKVYAITSEEYQHYRRAIMWHAADGTTFVFPSIMAYARARGVKVTHAWTSATRHWRVKGEHVEF